MSVLYTRHPAAGTVLDTLDLEIASYSPIKERADTNLFYSVMQSAMFLPITNVTVDHLYGFREVPDRYHIQTNLRRVCVFVKADPESPTQRFVWHTEGRSNDIVETLEINEDSLVFLDIQGTRLSYDKEKLLFIECQEKLNHPVTLLFTDNYGLPQSIQVEMGAWSTSDNIIGTFKSVSGEVEYPLDKVPYNALTIGLAGIKKELRDYVSGFVNSRIHGVLLDGLEDEFYIRSLETSLKDASITADNYTKQYNLSGVLSLNTKDLPDFTTLYGEINEHDI